MGADNRGRWEEVELARLRSEVEWLKRRVQIADEDVAKCAAERDRLRLVIRTGGAMYRAERACMGIPGGLDPEDGLR